jgi:hypothetical protein
MCEVHTEDGRNRTVELPVLRGCVDDEKTGLGFILDARNQYQDEDGYMVQVLWERSSLPVCMIETTKTEDLTALINQIYKESKKQSQLDGIIQAVKDSLSDKVGWIISLVCATFIVIAAIQKWG